MTKSILGLIELPCWFLLVFVVMLPNRGMSQILPGERLGYALVIHGGAGVMHLGAFSTEKEDLYHKSLKEALKIGEEILKNGGSSLNAVESVIVYLENDSLFNAGKGSVFTYDGIHELDASIMDGKTLSAGAVGGVRNIKNPIIAARAVMEKSGHVLLVGEGAEKFAENAGVELVDPIYFYTEGRYQAWKKFMESKQEEALKKRNSGLCCLG